MLKTRGTNFKGIDIWRGKELKLIIKAINKNQHIAENKIKEMLVCLLPVIHYRSIFDIEQNFNNCSSGRENII